MSIDSYVSGQLFLLIPLICFHCKNTNQYFRPMALHYGNKLFVICYLVRFQAVFLLYLMNKIVLNLSLTKKLAFVLRFPFLFS